ncbi:hypothetical protein [Paenimyroides marinum]|uniref:hypothetical protein n=1 Tax=Paenimyroides marinum TaxID=1159016 RepID=UPI00115FAFCE|nr:hypothetical protein [Paenimyroides aquimaris]
MISHSSGLHLIDKKLYLNLESNVILTEKDGFHKLYLFISGGGNKYLAAVFEHWVSFFQYPTVYDALLRDKIIAPLKLNFSLPQGTVTAFIYDFKYMAVVLQERLIFMVLTTRKGNG